MRKLHARLVIIVFSIIILMELSAWAADESKVVSSAEKVVKRWVELLPKKGSEAVCLIRKGGYWIVRHFNNVEVSYDVKKTDSIISPYILTISIWSSYVDNDQSPSANGYKYKDVWYGFKSEEEALSHINLLKDFKKRYPVERNYPSNFSHFEIYVSYLYREKFWEYKRWNGEEKRVERRWEELPIDQFTPLQEVVFGGDVKKNDGIICDLGKSEYFSNVLKDMLID